MKLTYSITDDLKVILKSGSKKIDQIGAFDTAESANYWGTHVCEKYNSPEYADIDYPNDLPDIG